jgi:hypothetical protein
MDKTTSFSVRRIHHECTLNKEREGQERNVAANQKLLDFALNPGFRG